MHDLIGYYETLSFRACVEKIFISHVINKQHLLLIEIVEMVSFELDEELRKMFFRLVTSVGWRKILSPHEESNLRPSDLRSAALSLSHQDSSMSEIYYEVLITRVLHTARISNVDSVMFLIEIVEMVSLELDEELRKMFFRLVTSVEQRIILSPHEESSSPSTKLI